MDWDGVWDVKVRTTETGWSAEFVIPFKTLRFSNSPQQEWGLNILRRVKRKNEDSSLVAVAAALSHHAPSISGTITGLEGIRQGRNLKIKPYGISSVTQLAANGLSNDVGANAGLDVKYGLTASQTLDLTYRTDFSQVEADQQQVNLTRFNVLFPEKREFFLENSGVFARCRGQRSMEARNEYLPVLQPPDWPERGRHAHSDRGRCACVRHDGTLRCRAAGDGDRARGGRSAEQLPRGAASQEFSEQLVGRRSS